MDEVSAFAQIVLIAAAGLALAIGSRALTERLPVPAPAIFLLAAAAASDLVPALGEELSIRDVERIAVVALVAILFDGGMHIGARRARAAIVPIAVLGVVGTFATAAVVAAAAHWLLGFDWTVSWIIGAAVAPTDPAVVFSVLGRRDVGGRSGTILEGESGANDPVGIALMIGLLEFATSDHASVWTIATEFGVEMAVGLAGGVAGGLALGRLMRRGALPSEALYPLQTLAAAGALYAAVALAHGSGFLAVFVAGILIGDLRAPYKAEIERFHSAIASLAEIVVFVALGLTIDLSLLGDDRRWLDGLVLALVLTFVARPLVAGALLLPVRLTRGEKAFIVWAGLKGAVPILLAAFAVLAAVEEAQRIYGIVFVVVLFSVVVQGGLVPRAAAAFGVPMRVVAPEPWHVSVRLRDEPHGIRRFVVGDEARAAGHAIRDLPISERTWIAMVVHEGRPVVGRGDYVLRPGDELLVLVEGADEAALQRLFEGATAARRET